MKKLLPVLVGLILTLMIITALGAALATPHPTPPDDSGAADKAAPTSQATNAAPDSTLSAPQSQATAAAAPTQAPGKLSGMIIGLDPGHQSHANRDKEPIAPGSSTLKAKVSSGAQGVKTRVNEYEVNLIIALKLRDRLEAEGATVVMTRETNDVDISNVERAQLMNDAKVDIWLRIHCNGSDTSRSTNGMSMYVCASGDTVDKSYEAGKLLLEEMSAATGAKANGVHKTDTYTGNNWSKEPCVLVEMGYMSNPAEDEKLNDPDYQQKLIDGYVAALAKWNAEYSGLNIVEPEDNGVM